MYMNSKLPDGFLINFENSLLNLKLEFDLVTLFCGREINDFSSSHLGRGERGCQIITVIRLSAFPLYADGTISMLTVIIQ